MLITQPVTRPVTGKVTNRTVGMDLPEFSSSMKAETTPDTGRGPILFTRSTGTNVLDNTGIYRAVSAYYPAPYGARFISADVWSKYDATGTLLTTAKGFVCGPQRKNKCENYNFNPDVGLVGVSVTAGSITRQADVAALASAGLAYLSTDGNVFEYINSSGLDQTITVTDQCTNTNIHALSVFAKVTGGTVTMKLTGGATTNVTTADYSRTIYSKVTPLATTDQLQFVVPDGVTFRWVGNGFEEGNAVTAPITTVGAAVTRTADTHTIPISNFRDEMTVTFKWTPHFNYDDLPAGTYNKGVISPSSTATPSIMKYGRAAGGGGLISIADVSANSAPITLAYAKDTTYNVCASFSKARGLQGICVAGTDSGDGAHAGFTLASVITFGMSANEEYTIADLKFEAGWANPATRAILAPV